MTTTTIMMMKESLIFTFAICATFENCNSYDDCDTMATVLVDNTKNGGGDDSRIDWRKLEIVKPKVCQESPEELFDCLETWANILSVDRISK